jgi:Short C-terminal domain
MRTPRNYPVLLAKSLLVLSVVVLMLSIGGYIMSQMRNVASVATFGPNSVSGYRTYGEVPIPGDQTLHLPAGKVAITFHAVTVGIPEAGLPIPDLKLDINPPDGVADPAVTESTGGTTSFNNDAWRQVWVADIPQAGDYHIATDGKVSAFVSAHLAFGYVNFSPASPAGPSHTLLHASQIAFAAALLTLSLSVLAVRRLSSGAAQSESQAPFEPANSGFPAHVSAEPAREPGIAGRLQELETLRASGAISDAEYAAKRQQIIADI